MKAKRSTLLFLTALLFLNFAWPAKAATEDEQAFNREQLAESLGQFLHPSPDRLRPVPPEQLADENIRRAGLVRRVLQQIPEIWGKGILSKDEVWKIVVVEILKADLLFYPGIQDDLVSFVWQHWGQDSVRSLAISLWADRMNTDVMNAAQAEVVLSFYTAASRAADGLLLTPGVFLFDIASTGGPNQQVAWELLLRHDELRLSREKLNEAATQVEARLKKIEEDPGANFFANQTEIEQLTSQLAELVYLLAARTGSWRVEELLGLYDRCPVGPRRADIRDLLLKQRGDIPEERIHELLAKLDLAAEKNNWLSEVARMNRFIEAVANIAPADPNYARDNYLLRWQWLVPEQRILAGSPPFRDWELEKIFALLTEARQKRPKEARVAFAWISQLISGSLLARAGQPQTAAGLDNLAAVVSFCRALIIPQAQNEAPSDRIDMQVMEDDTGALMFKVFREGLPPLAEAAVGPLKALSAKGALSKPILQGLRLARDFSGDPAKSVRAAQILRAGYQGNRFRWVSVSPLDLFKNRPDYAPRLAFNNIPYNVLAGTKTDAGFEILYRMLEEAALTMPPPQRAVFLGMVARQIRPYGKPDPDNLVSFRANIIEDWAREVARDQHQANPEGLTELARRLGLQRSAVEKVAP